MAYTALQVVNRIFKRVGEIQGDASDITSFTDSAHQRAIDVALQILNEIVQEMYVLGALVGEVEEATVTLATGTREYAFESDFEQMSGESYLTRVMVSLNDFPELYEYPGGYPQMFRDQPQASDWTGTPNMWAINPTTNKIRFDRTPEAAQNGIQYKYLYDKRLSTTAITDTFPFSDTVMDGLLPGIAEIWSVDLDRDSRRSIIATRSFNRAVTMITQTKPRKQYGVRRAHTVNLPHGGT